jgi:hypothetical protein
MEVESLQRYLHKKLPDLQVPLTPVIVFSSPTVELDIADTSVPAVHAKQLKEWLRGNGKSGKLASNVRAELLRLFENGK